MATWFFERDGALRKLWVDIATPVQWVAADEAVFIDLDIDVERWAGREPELLDMEEFDLKSAALPYPDAVVEAAKGAAATVYEMASANAPPFDRRTLARWSTAAGINAQLR